LPGGYDCIDLVLEVLKDEYSIDTCLVPNHGTYTISQQRQIRNRLSDYSKDIDTPEDGCLVVMKQGQRLRHLGIYYTKGKKGYIIHNSSIAKAVVQTTANRIEDHGFTIDRYLKWSKK